mmetsp:Transcript_13585/g.20126  ORF Transcript_13585/g.20126 Transcript_13585/m.20126 type:complete len:199 (-) Transcript_13585:31-627(-)
MGRGDSERRCEPVVKDLLQQSHRKCDLQKNGTMVLGEFLNRLAGGSSVLEEDREYRVCARTAARTKGMRRKKRARSPVREIRRSNRLLGIEIHSDSESETPDPWAGRGTPRRTTFSREIETRTSPFYSHCLRFYLPKHAEELFTEHGVGLGVFTMQGYERRNKESKNTLKRFTNHKGNILVQNMKRLWDIFKHSMNSY